MRAALTVHEEFPRTGRRVDAVTVARQQELNSRQFGDGVAIEAMGALIERGTGTNVVHAADIVLRGSITRLTSQAAQAVAQLAGDPSLQLSEFLQASPDGGA